MHNSGGLFRKNTPPWRTTAASFSWSGAPVREKVVGSTPARQGLSQREILVDAGPKMAQATISGRLSIEKMMGMNQCDYTGVDQLTGVRRCV
jgi:hypothetical protein